MNISRLIPVVTLTLLSLMSQVLVTGVNPQIQLFQQNPFYYNPPAPLNGTYTTNGFSLDPAAVVDNHGDLWVAWESNSGGSFQIFYQIYNGIAWTTPTVVSTAAFNSAPTLAQLANGTMILVWAAGTNGNDDHLYYKSYTNGVWSSIVTLTSGSTFTDELPKGIITTDSTLLLFFERDTSTGPSTPPDRQIYYRTLSGNKWSSDILFTTDSNSNRQPSPMPLGNGGLWVAWTRTITGSSPIIYYRTYDGTGWSGDIALTSPGPVVSPDLVQDRNGTIWVYWSQNFALSSTVTQNNIVYRSTTNFGSTWSSPQNLTVWGDPENPINSYAPFGVQGIDTSLYVFFATDVATPNVNGFHIYYVKSSQIYPVHNVGITRVQVSPTMNYPYGDAPTNIAAISITVRNFGDYSESVTVNLQASNKTSYNLGSQSGSIPASLSTVFTFRWNVSGLTPARYTLVASTPAVAGETQGNGLDNTLTAKPGVMVVYAGDVLRHGIVDIFDETVMGHAWQSTINGPCVSGVGSGCNWNPDCDILRHGVVDINDETVAGANWQKKI